MVEDEMVRLVQTSYQPLAGTKDQLAYLTRNLGDHRSAATENVLGEGTKHLERAVHYSDLSIEQILELKEEHQRAQMKLFEALSQ